MKPAAESLLAGCVRAPGSAGYALAQWDLLIRQARSSNLLARVAIEYEAHGLLATVPEAPRNHLIAAATLARRHRRSACYEIEAVGRALASTGVVPVLLKGAAYQAAELRAAHGRLYGDIDILVPKDRLGDVESALIRSGWQTSDSDPYTQRYYRQWMHELPPMRHLSRATTLDVHHTILPPTAKRHLDAGLLLERAVRASAFEDMKVLAPADMVLHSATHLFYDGELEHGFRDLVDLDSLLRELSGRDARLWTTLVARAQQLDLERPLFYALRYAQAFLQTPVPSDCQAAVQGPVSPLLAGMDALFLRALAPSHASCSDRLTPLARKLLYLRAHWLRMPLPLLTYHLLRKALTPAPSASTDSQVKDR
jgi:hypothetical protein